MLVAWFAGTDRLRRVGPLPRPDGRLRRVTALVTAAAALALPACSDRADGDSVPRTGAEIAWTRIDLPSGEEPVALAALGDDLLIGLRLPGARPVPRLRIRDAGGRLTPVPIKPITPYAFEATWHSLATSGDEILAIGGAPGGAHSNTRWTTWAGTTAGVVEKPQSFYAFGGWGAGNLFDAVTTPAGSALVGSWGSEIDAGLDGAVWLPDGDAWVRQNPAGTALQSTAELSVGPRSAAAAGDGIVVAGSQVKLAPGSVRQSAALWRSTRLNEGWARLELPDAGDRSEAVSASCTAQDCTVAGYADGKLAVWTLRGTEAARVQGVPDVAVGDKDIVPAPIDVDGRLIQVASDAGRIVALVHDGESWASHGSTGPAGVVTEVIRVGDTLFLLAGPPGKPAALWRADVAALR